MKSLILKLANALASHTYTYRLVIFVEIANYLIGKIRKDNDYLNKRLDYLTGKGEATGEKSDKLEDEITGYILTRYTQKDTTVFDYNAFAKSILKSSGKTEKDYPEFFKTRQGSDTCKVKPCK